MLQQDSSSALMSFFARLRLQLDQFGAYKEKSLNKRLMAQSLEAKILSHSSMSIHLMK